MLEWDPIELATADLMSLSLYRNSQKAGNIPRPLQMHSTKISGLAVDTEYTFHLVLRTTAGTRTSEKVTVRTHKMTDLSGITITTGILSSAARANLSAAVERIGAKIADGVRIDTTHFVTTEGRGTAWEKAVENNIPVVRPEWVDACEKNGRILGVTKFYLDAMRPGPPSEGPMSPPPVPAKDEASPPAAAADDDDAEATNGAADSAEAAGDLDRDPEQKAKTPLHPDDQKMRLEDKEERNLALRPSLSSRGGGDDEDDDDAAARGAAGDAREKPAATPDRASFQEVEL